MKAISKLINKEQYTDIQFKHIVLENYLLQHLALYIYIYIKRERERKRKRWVQVTTCVTLKSYTFFKSLDLSRSNKKKKKTLINANILIQLIYYSLFNIFHIYF